MGRADGDRVAQLLLGITRTQGEHGHLATMLFDELHGTFDGALLVGARGEPEVGGIDVLPVGGHVDLCARRGTRFTQQRIFMIAPDQPFRRVSSGSKAEPLPTTVQG